MKLSNGKIIISIGIIHTGFTLAPFAFGKQFVNFSHQYFFMISKGFLENGQMNYETFAAFWCFCFGIFLFPLGILLEFVEKNYPEIPQTFLISYLIVILVAIYMIPFGGFTVFLLPHAIYMLIKNKKLKKT